MTNDPVSEQELHAYLDGELPQERRRAVERFLVDHPEKAELLAEWAAQRDAIAAAYDPVLAEPIPAALAEAARRNGRPPAWRAIAAATLIAAFGGGFLLGAATGGLSRPSLADAGLTAHRLYIPEKIHAVEVTAADRPHLESWLSKRVGLTVAAPDLSASGLTLLGGRVAPANGGAAALFMYENGSGERFTLMVAKTPDPDSRVAYHEAGAFGAFDWGRDGYGFVLSGPHDEALLEKVRKGVEANWF